ncbi:MAG: HlyC/CorC family transporter [Ignavibacteriales bacterium]|nr:HlyC/CorC family transporter [Ignavibacteriales bacterium]
MSVFEWIGEILVVLFFVFLNGFFVAAEFAIVKVRATQIQPLAVRGNRRAKIANELITHLDAYLSATQLGITIASLALGWLGEPYVASMVRPAVAAVGIVDESLIRGISFAIAFTIITFLHIVLGELAPKSLAIQKAQVTTLWVAYPLRLFYLIFRPIINFLNGLANAILRLAGLQTVSESEMKHSNEELRMLLLQEQDVSVTSKHMVLNAMDFRKKQARHCLVPRKEMVSLRITDSIQKNLGIMRSNKFSRYPVYKDTIDNIIGIVHTKDVFKTDRDHRPDFTIDSVLRDAVVLPETAPLERVLETMIQKKSHMIILVDEFGGTAGLITLEDVLEEIVGTIQDEFDREAPEVTRISDTEYIVEASITTNDVEKLIGQELSDRDIQSIGAFVIEHFGHLPAKDERITINGAEFTIEKVDDRVIETIRVRKLPLEQSEDTT